MPVITQKQGVQHFSGNGTDSVTFSRSVYTLFFNISGGDMEVSFDGGDGYMTVDEGTHYIDRVALNTLHFNGGNDWSGVGFSL